MIAKKLLLLTCITQLCNNMAMELSTQEKIENYRKAIKIEEEEKLGSTNPYQLSVFFNGKNSIFDVLSPKDHDIAKILWQSTVYCTNILKDNQVKFSYALDVEPLKKALQQSNILLLEKQKKQIEQLQTQIEEAKQTQENLQQLHTEELRSLQAKWQSHKKQQKAQPTLLQNPLVTFGLGALFAGLVLKLPAIIRTAQ